MLAKGQDLNVLISVLARTYEQIFLMEKTAQSGRLINTADGDVTVDYDVWCTNTCAKDYMGDDEKSFLKKISREMVLDALRYEDEYVVEYSAGAEGEERRMRFKAFFCLNDEIVCMTLSDITKEYLYVNAVAQFTDKCMDIAYECSAAKEDFFQHIEQQMKGPLYSMEGMLDEALEKEGEEKEAYIKDAKNCLMQYSSMLEQLFMKSAMEKGELELQEEVILTESLLGQIGRFVDEKAKEKRISFELKNLSPKTVAFVSDYKLIKMLFMYLVDVCMRYSKSEANVIGEVLFDCREETAEDAEVFDLVFCFKADGMDAVDMIAKEKKMFTFCQRMADSLEGILHVDELQNETKITLRIPVTPADEEEAREKGIVTHLADSMHERDFSSYRALVVDDDEYRCQVTATKLERFGLSVDMAFGGQEAIDMLVAAPMRYYHIMFINPMLPDKSGYETTMELREMKRIDLNDITIVALTTNALRDDRMKALENGMDYHIEIPFDDIEMKEILIRELQDIGPDDEHELFGFRVIK
ncbi:MAG: response regulator [Lachnospiraceae bacterium]|nr:response regulator [Lachnospiraceae bacterium]